MIGVEKAKSNITGGAGFVQSAKQAFLHNWRLYTLLLPALIWLAVFMYAPMYGSLLAFKDFKVRLGILGSPWADPLFKYFKQFFSTSVATMTIRNTLTLSLQTLLISFPAPILFALLLNQVNKVRAKKFVQTVSYAPYFISNVVVVGMMTVILAPGTGFVNTIITSLGFDPVLFMTRPEYFRPIYILSNMWQYMGFSAIIYIAALTGISPDYYEAALIDGATKVQRIKYIDIPLILPTIIIMLILDVGKIMSIGYEKVFLMQNSMNTTASEIISTYVYKTGLLSAQYSFATAVGLFNSVVNFILLVIANQFAKKYSDISIL